MWWKHILLIVFVVLCLTNHVRCSKKKKKEKNKNISEDRAKGKDFLCKLKLFILYIKLPNNLKIT